MLFKSFKLLQLINSFHQNQESLSKCHSSRLKEMVCYVLENVDFWKELKNSYDSETLESIIKGDISSLPIIDKSTYKKNPRGYFLSNKINPDRCMSVRTSGATGIPFEMLKTSRESKLMELIFSRGMFMSGCHLFDSLMTVCCPYDFHKNSNLFSIIGLKRKKHVSAFLSMDKLIDEINNFRPKVLRAYASTLLLLARFIEKKNVSIYPPKLVISGSDLLTREARSRIEEVLRTRIVDFYGTVETGNIAFECKNCGHYHINSDFLHVEFLKDGKPVNEGQRGEVVITSLFHRAKPLIRYAIGDRGEPAPLNRCSSTNMMSMKSIEGRLVDFIILPDDVEVSPYALTDTIKSVKGVEEFQAIQEDKRSLFVQVVAKEVSGSKISDGIREALYKLLGEEVKIEIEFIDEIKRYPGEKFRVVTSHVPR